MSPEDNQESMMKDYFGFDFKTLMIFGGLVLGVIVIVTGIYVAIFGFDSWQNSMSQAGSLMLANVNVPINGPGAGTNQNMAIQTPMMAPVTPVAGQTGAQFACPTCGAAGLPLWSANGSPLCPSCGALMGIAGGFGNPAAGQGSPWP